MVDVSEGVTEERTCLAFRRFSVWGLRQHCGELTPHFARLPPMYLLRSFPFLFLHLSCGFLTPPGFSRGRPTCVLAPSSFAEEAPSPSELPPGWLALLGQEECRKGSKRPSAERLHPPPPHPVPNPPLSQGPTVSGQSRWTVCMDL